MCSSDLMRIILLAPMLTAVMIASAFAQTRPPAVEQAIATAQAAMTDLLAKQYPRDKIVTRVENGQFGTVIAVAAFPGAYPGTGVLRQLIDGATGIAYGGRAERSFADFARERGWLAKPPDTDALMRTLNTALFEGVAILDYTSPPKITGAPHELRIEVIQRYMPSNSGQILIVTVAATGRETLVRQPLKAP